MYSKISSLGGKSLFFVVILRLPAYYRSVFILLYSPTLILACGMFVRRNNGCIYTEDD